MQTERPVYEEIEELLGNVEPPAGGARRAAGGQPAGAEGHPGGGRGGAALRRSFPTGTVAVGVGSRGVGRISDVVAALVGFLKEAGAEPFVVPAMGSHGASTAEGQADVLRHLGVSEERVGCPIRATMEAQKIGETPGGVAVYMDQNAFEADAVVVVNRIKPSHRLPRDSRERADEDAGHRPRQAEGRALDTRRRVGQDPRDHPRGSPGRRTERQGSLRPRRPRERRRGALQGGRGPRREAGGERSALAGGSQAQAHAVALRRYRRPGDRPDREEHQRRRRRPERDGPLPLPPSPPAARTSSAWSSSTSRPRPAATPTASGPQTWSPRGWCPKWTGPPPTSTPLTSTTPYPVKIPMTMPTDRMAIAAALAMTAGVSPQNARLVRIKNTLKLRQMWVSGSVAGRGRRRRAAARSSRTASHGLRRQTVPCSLAGRSPWTTRTSGRQS